MSKLLFITNCWHRVGVKERREKCGWWRKREACLKPVLKIHEK